MRLEMITTLEVAPEHLPVEGRGLPISRPAEGPRLIGDDVPARDGNREVELPDAESMRTRLKIDVPRSLPDPGPLNEPERRRESRVDPVEGHEVVEQIVRIIGGDPSGERDTTDPRGPAPHHPELRFHVLAAHHQRQ